MGWIPEIFVRQELIAVEDEAERKIKGELQVSIKGKGKMAQKEKGTKERDLLKKEWILLSHAQKNFYFSLKSLKPISTWAL